MGRAVLLRASMLLAFVTAGGCSCEEPPETPPDQPAGAPVETPQAPAPAEAPLTSDEEIMDDTDDTRPAHRTRLVLLGTGTPNAEPDRSGPSVAVVVDDTAYVIDLGPGVVRRAVAAAQRGEPALAPERIERAFLTHLHSDHTVGLPDMVFTPWVLGRAAPLALYGPPGTAAMAEHVMAAWQEDVRVRTEGLEHANATGWHIDAHEVHPGEVYRDERVRVTAFSVPHGSWAYAFGYRFEGPDRTIVISGDTGPTDAVADACDGCDVLVHEVYSVAGFQTRPASWKEYHRSFHTSAAELAAVATRARPGLLVLYHHLLWGSTPEQLVDEVRAGYGGDVVFGRDLDVY